MDRLVLVDQERWADFFQLALFADDVHQFATRELQVIVFAELKKLS